MRRFWLELAVVSVLATGVPGCGRSEVAEAVRDLPARERQALYERTLGNLTAVCRAEPSARSSDYCTEQARLIVGLDECDAGCRDLALSILLPATR